MHYRADHQKALGALLVPMNRLAIGAISALALASCGAAQPFPAKFRADYLASCREPLAGTARDTGSLASGCSCSLRYIEAHVPPKSAEAYERAVVTETHPISRGLRGTGPDPAHDMGLGPSWLRAAIRACRRQYHPLARAP